MALQYTMLAAGGAMLVLSAMVIGVASLISRARRPAEADVGGASDKKTVFLFQVLALQCQFHLDQAEAYHLQEHDAQLYKQISLVSPRAQLQALAPLVQQPQVAVGQALTLNNHNRR